jgi:hypothetical protein
VVRALHARITADRRHVGVVTIDSGTTEKRQFEDWSMGFIDLDAGRAGLPAGYSEFFDLPLTDPAYAESPSRCRALLRLFSQIE